MAVVVVNEVEFGVVVFRRPLEGLRDVAGFRDGTERRVGIRCADVAGGTEDFADVFRDVVTVGKPRSVLLNRKRARRRRLSRIPGYEPQSRMRRARQIKRRNLQIPAIDVAVVKRRCSIPYMVERIGILIVSERRGSEFRHNEIRNHNVSIGAPLCLL